MFVLNKTQHPVAVLFNLITPNFIEKGMFRIIMIDYLMIVFYRL